MDRQILRSLAAAYLEVANSDRNHNNILLHRAVNDLKQQRPIVLIDEIPWHEMNLDDELTLRCENAENREIEWFFRTTLYRWRHMPGDMAVRPYYGVEKVIRSTGNGLTRQFGEDEHAAQAHTFVNQIPTEADMEKLHNEVITYDREESMRRLERTADLFGDILPVRLVGEATGYSLGHKPIDDITFYRGLDTFFYDFVEEPEFMHRLMARLTDIFLDKLAQYEALDLLDGDAYYCHCASALTNDLPAAGDRVRACNTWGRGLAQIFASVSPAMHDEFDITYAIRALEPFGLVYYGCCEPLDRKIDIVAKIPNLRKISITPWADVDLACEIMQNQYVVSSKPNPSQLAIPVLDEESTEAELQHILSAVKRNGCSAELVLKDITTVHGRPENLFRWQEIAMKLVESW